MSSEEFTVTPWNVEGAIDYDKLVQKFGTEKISPQLQARIEKKFDVNLILQDTDDEKFLYSDEKSFGEVSKYTTENILDIIAIGFDPRKTKILIDTKDIKRIYPISLEIAKRITFSTVKAAF